MRSLLACVVGSLALSPGLWAQATTAGDGRDTPAFEPLRQRDSAGRVTGPTRAGWWNDGVFYQVFVRSFKDSTTGPLANDGIGDLRGLIENLDYLNDGDAATTNDLGVTGIWLMPINPSPTYHGYDVTDYYRVNPEYGTLDDLRELVAQCHRRGIKVIIDLVLNHASDEHPWFAESQDPGSPKRDWFIWSAQDPNYRGPWNQMVWHPATPARRRGEAARGPFFYGLFSRKMPDLNYRNPEVSAEMLRVVRFWLDRSAGGPRIGLDGFRLDAIRHLIEDGRQQDNTRGTHEWLQKFYREYKAVAPEAVAVGEVWASTPIAASYVGGQMDLTFEFDLAGAMVEAARKGEAAPVIAAQERVLKFFPPNQYGRFLTNHDQTRVATELKGEPGKLRAAAAMLLLGPGVPFVYYAEELGQPGAKPDPDLRTPMPWTVDDRGFTLGTPWRKRHAAPAGTTVAEQAGADDSLLSHYRRLIALRRAEPALAHGSYAAVPASDPGVYAFARAAADGRTVLVVVNLSAREVPAAKVTPGTALPEGWSGRDALGGDGRGPATAYAGGSITLPPLSAHQTAVFLPGSP